MRDRGRGARLHARERRGPAAAASSATPSLQSVAADPSRHVVLVTATPHSGNEEAFRSLLRPAQGRFRRPPGERPGPGPNARAFAGASPATSCSAAAPTSAAISRSTPRSPSARTRRPDVLVQPRVSQALFDDLLAFAREYAIRGPAGRERRRAGPLLVGARAASLRLVEPRRRGRDIAEPGRRRRSRRRGRRRGGPPYRPRSGRR